MKQKGYDEKLHEACGLPKEQHEWLVVDGKVRWVCPDEVSRIVPGKDPYHEWDRPC